MVLVLLLTHSRARCYRRFTLMLPYSTYFSLSLSAFTLGKYHSLLLNRNMSFLQIFEVHGRVMHGPFSIRLLRGVEGAFPEYKAAFSYSPNQEQSDTQNSDGAEPEKSLHSWQAAPTALALHYFPLYAFPSPPKKIIRTSTV